MQRTHNTGGPLMWRALGVLISSCAMVLLSGSLVDASTGTGWSKVSIPPLAQSTSKLNVKESFSDIVTVPGSGNMTVLAGSYTVQTKSKPIHSQIHPVVMRVDNNTVTNMSPPAPNESMQFMSVSALSSSDIWAVGWSQPGYDYSNNTNAFPLAEHWNGSSWSATQLPSPDSTTPGVLYGVAASASDNVWAVGYSLKDPHGVPTTFLFHWNGSQWTSIPETVKGVFLAAVGTTGPDDVWLAGGTATSAAPLIQHWNGATLSVVPTPSSLASGAGGTLVSVLEIHENSAKDVWFLAQVTSGTSIQNSVSYPLVLHWNGSKISQIANVPIPHGDTVIDVSGISSTSSSDVWITGTAFQHLGESAKPYPYLAHFDGTAWTSVDIQIGGKVQAGALTGVVSFGNGHAAVLGDSSGTDVYLLEHTGSTVSSTVNVGALNPQNAGATPWIIAGIVIVVVIIGGAVYMIRRRSSGAAGRTAA